jgi:rod shape determining protein RodA
LSDSSAAVCWGLPVRAEAVPAGLTCRWADNRAMSAVFEKPSLRQRLMPLFQGFDGPLAFAVFLLVCAGLLTMYSSGYDHGTRFVDHGRNMILAGMIMFVVAQVPPQRLMTFAVPLYVLGVSLLVAVALFGLTKKGARRWINLGVVIQPSEILKIAMPLMLAWWFQRREGQLRPLDFLVAGLLLVLPVGLIMKQPDLGTSLLVLAAGLSVIFFAGLSWRLILPPVLLGVIGVALVVWFEPRLCADGVRWPVLHDYQQQRICTLLDPSRDPLGKGFHIIQGMIAIGSGGVFGKGFMAGTQTHLEFIPERTTDFIFAAFSEEFGLIGNLCLIVSFLFLVGRGLMIALEAPTLFSRLLAGAVCCIFFTYAFVNMGMVSGILPVVGVPLPFISYGGTAMVTLGMGLGILMSVARAKRLVPT